MTEYQKYQLQWMIDHGYSLDDLIQELTNMQYDDPEDSDRISTPISELYDEWVGDRYIGRWATWLIDQVRYDKGELLLYCTKTWNEKVETNERYVSCKKG